MLLEMTGKDNGLTASALLNLGYEFSTESRLWRGWQDASGLIDAGLVREYHQWNWEMIYAFVTQYEFDGSRQAGGVIVAARGEMAMRQLAKTGPELDAWYVNAKFDVPERFEGLLVFKGSVAKTMLDSNGSTDAVFEGSWRFPTKDEVLMLFRTEG